MATRSSGRKKLSPREDDTGGGIGAQSVARDTSTARYLRGSSLLLAGRLVALGLNFGVQVLTVRYLLKSDYGAFAYAMAIASMGASVLVLGLNRGVNRFVPIDHEHGDYRSMFGTMLLALGAVTGLGLALVAVVIGAQGLILRTSSAEPLAITLLVVLIGLAPLQALDNVLQGLVATFARARVLCLRRYVIGPALKLAAVLIVVLAKGSVTMLAWCYLIAGLMGVGTYVVLLVQALAREGVLSSLFHPVYQVRRLLRFSLPLLSTDLFLALHVTIAVVLLEYFRDAEQVAELRAVAPVAGLCSVAMQSFKLLFTPLASRLYARQDHAGLNEIYWRSTVWITITTFPVFAVCFFLAEPVTVLLFGSRYQDAGVLLAILSAGTYFSAAMGLNLYVLQAFARIRAIIIVNTAATCIALALAVWLTPWLGAVGAALAISGTVAAHNVMIHVGLATGTGVALFQARYLRVYLSIAAGIAVLAGVHWLCGSSITVMAIAVAVISFLMVWLNRGVLDLGDAFPQLGRIPLLRRMIGVQFG